MFSNNNYMFKRKNNSYSTKYYSSESKKLGNILRRNQDKFRAGIESNKVGHQFPSL